MTPGASRHLRSVDHDTALLALLTLGRTPFRFKHRRPREWLLAGEYGFGRIKKRDRFKHEEIGAP